MGPRKPSRSNRPKENSFPTNKNPASSRKPSQTNSLPAEAPASSVTSLPIELQQIVLNVFSNAFPLAASDADLKSTIQVVKGHLYNRDFATAFRKQEYLVAYALRWSAARALAYADILEKFDPYSRWISQSGEDQKPRIVCIGGGAGAEIAALAVLVKYRALPALQLDAVDVADWSHCLESLQRSVITPPPLWKYASESVRAANRSLLEPEQLSVSFTHEDVLEYDEHRLREKTVGTNLVTIMFTLNELFTTSLSRTTAFLLNLTSALDCGAWLLVVDSPGTYSEVKLGKDGEVKKYPMKWLLDHTLLEVAGEDRWKKEIEEDSKWFRLDSRLKYPIELEDMRYQLHVYRRGSGT